MGFDFHLSQTNGKIKEVDQEQLVPELRQIIGNELRKREETAWNYWKDQYPYFMPEPGDLKDLPKYSWLLKICFTLEKPFISKDENELHPYDNSHEIQNPVVRDWILGCPIIRPTTWKGHLRFAARIIKNDDQITRRLFGNETHDKEQFFKGRLHFFPTFFNDKHEVDVITPLSRETRTPREGPIKIEVVPVGTKGEFYLLYVPFPRGTDYVPRQIKKDLGAVIKSLEAMFLTYGFSAKKTSGFGVANEDIKGSMFYINGGEKKTGNKDIEEAPIKKVTDFKNIGKLTANLESISDLDKIKQIKIDNLKNLEHLLDKFNWEGK